jgi:hypothetical protein
VPIRPLIVLGLLLAGAPAFAQDFAHIVGFHNVSSPDGGEHCLGYSLGLWKHRGRVLGLLDLHSGLCGDPPCAAIEDAKFDENKGRIEFRSSIQGEKLEFAGTIGPKAVVDTMNGERVRLARQAHSSWPEFAPNRSISSWCAFWTTVPRCQGVRELCRSFGRAQ